MGSPFVQVLQGGSGARGGGVMRVSPNGGTPEVLIALPANEGAFSDAQVLPGGQAVLFALAKGTSSDRWDKAQVVVQSLKSGERKTLVEGGSDARYVPTDSRRDALGGTCLRRAAQSPPPSSGQRRAETSLARPTRLCTSTNGPAQFSRDGFVGLRPRPWWDVERWSRSGAGRSQGQRRDPEASARLVRAPSRVSGRETHRLRHQ